MKYFETHVSGVQMYQCVINLRVADLIAMYSQNYCIHYKFEGCIFPSVLYEVDQMKWKSQEKGY